MTGPTNLDPTLAREYSRPGPRYTSYPTAPHFAPAEAATSWRACLARAAAKAPDAPLSLYVHLPFCDTLCWFCACTVVISNRQNTIDRYADHLIQEIQRTAELVAPRRRVLQVHFGGGSPSHAGPDNLRRIVAAMRSSFDFMPDTEVSIEVDPPDVDDAVADGIADAGFNRVSMGIQEFDQDVQKAINRLQSPELTASVFRRLRERGITAINTDLVYGLPHQTLEGLARTMTSLVELAPDRVACFGYAHVPWLKAHQKLIKEEHLPDPDQRLQMLLLVVETLTREGYEFLGLDHFARPDDSLVKALREGTLQRNFQGYSTHGGSDLLAFGISGISHVGGGYFQNTKNVVGYQNKIEANEDVVERGLVLSAEDQLRHDVIMGLMCQFRLDYAEIEQRHGIVFQEHFANELADLAEPIADGLVEVHDDHIQVTETGRIFVRNVAMAFDAYLRRARAGAGEEPRYSKTV